MLFDEVTAALAPETVKEVLVTIKDPEFPPGRRTATGNNRT